MRIALVAGEDPGWGGIGTYTGVLGGALADLGHDVHLVLRGWEGDGDEELGGLPVHRVSAPEPNWRRGTEAVVSRLYTSRQALVFSARVARRVRELDVDVVEAPEFHAPGLFTALRRSPPVLVRLHTPAYLTSQLANEQRTLDGRAEEALARLAVSRATAITAPSAAVAREVGARWRLPPARIPVIPSPVDDHLFTPGPGAQPATILVVGRVERAKGQDLVVEALPALPEARLRMVGEDGGLLDAVLARAKALGVADRVEAVGAVPRSELPAHYRAATVCAVPSRFESFGYTCAEAMACGRPVVAAAAGGLAEIISDGEDGFLAAPDDAEALASALGGVLVDPALQQRLGFAARETVEQRFAAPAVAARLADLYSRVA